MEARDLAVDHLAAVRARVAELKALERDLSNFVGRCDAACAGGPGPDCVVLRDMAKPALGVAASKSERKPDVVRSEEHTSELQSLMRISYAVFCLKKKKTTTHKKMIERTCLYYQT